MTFNYIEEALNKQTEQDFKKSSVYKIAKENNVDSAVLEGNQPDENAGLIKFQELDQHDKTVYLRDVVDFVQQLPKDTMIGLGKGATNAAHILNNLTNVLGINPDDSYEFIQEKLSKQKQALMNMEEESPLINKLISMLPQGTMYTVPIYNKLKAAGIPNSYAFPISAAIGSTLGFDKTETFFVDSKLMQATKEAMGIPPDSSYEEVYDRIVQTAEYGMSGAIMERLFKGVMAAKKLDAVQGQQGSVAVGAGAGSGAVIDTVTPNTQNVTESEEKKTLNFDEQSQISSPMPDDNEMASAGLGPVFKSILKEAAKKIPNKGSGEQIFNTLKNTPGVKQQELKWSGLDDFLKNKKTATKEEVKEYLENNSLDVSEVQRPRRNTPFEDEQELLLESKLNELDDAIEKFTEANPDALVTNDLDKYKFKSRTLGSGMSEEVETGPFSKMKILFEGLTEDDLLSKYKYNNKIVIHNLQLENQPFTRTGPLNVEEADRLLKSGQYNRTSRYEIEPLEVRKYFTTKELKKVDERIMSSGPKFDRPDYVEPGGEDYKEIIFKLKGDRSYPIEQELLAGAIDGSTKKKVKSSFPYRSPSVHFGTKNEFAHVRFKTRYMDDPPMPSNKLKVLSVEEMQSDIVQDMSKNFGERVTDFPFKNNWYELVTKRLIRYAADNDFDAVAIPKGETIANRYKQSTAKATRVNVKPKLTEAGTDPSFEVTYFGGGNRELKRKTFYAEELNQFEKEIGSKNYSQLKDNIDNFVKNRPEDELFNTNYFAEFDEPLIVGSGKGKIDLYDKAIPSFMKKYGKKWNAKVYDDNIDINFNQVKDWNTMPSNPDDVADSIPVTILEITPEMKKSVQQDSQALFNIFGLGTGAAVGSKAILEDKGNNTISN